MSFSELWERWTDLIFLSARRNFQSVEMESAEFQAAVTEVKFGGMYYDYTIQAENQDYRVVQMNEGAGMKVWQVGDNVCLQLKNKDGVVKRYEE